MIIQVNKDRNSLKKDQVELEKERIQKIKVL